MTIFLKANKTNKKMKKENINKILKIGVIKKLVIISVIAISNSLTAQVDRSIMPESGPAPEISFGQPKTFSLDNGLTVMVVENNKLPRASAQLSFDNPLIYEGEIAGVNGVLGEMLGNGTSSIPKDKFINEVDYLGASLSVSGSGAFASSLSKYFFSESTSGANFCKAEYFYNVDEKTWMNKLDKSTSLRDRFGVGPRFGRPVGTK